MKKPFSLEMFRLFVFKCLMNFTSPDILGCGHCIRGPSGDLGDADSGLAVAPRPFHHSTLHLCRPVLCEFDFLGRGTFHINTQRLHNGARMLCVAAVATRKRSLRRADRKPGEGSGHAEAHRSRERGTHAARKTHCCQTSGRHLYCGVV